MSSSWIMIDIESDGPCPGINSMICFGAVVVEPGLERRFYGRLKPVTDVWEPEALAVSGFTRDETLAFPDPKAIMQRFADWLKENANPKGRPIFVADTGGFDWHGNGSVAK